MRRTSKLWRLLWLVPLIGVSACEGPARTERAESFTGQTESRQSDEPGRRPGPGRLSVKGLHGPN